MVDAETVRKRINEMMLEVSDSGEDFLRTLLEEYLDELGVELGIEFDSSAVLVELGLAAVLAGSSTGGVRPRRAPRQGDNQLAETGAPAPVAPGCSPGA